MPFFSRPVVKKASFTAGLSNYSRFKLFCFYKKSCLLFDPHSCLAKCETSQWATWVSYYLPFRKCFRIPLSQYVQFMSRVFAAVEKVARIRNDTWLLWPHPGGRGRHIALLKGRLWEVKQKTEELWKCYSVIMLFFFSPIFYLTLTNKELLSYWIYLCSRPCSIGVH